MHETRWKGPPLAIAALVGFMTALAGACGGASPGVTMLDRAALLDPAACKTCHPTHVDQWSASMHAYAADDPVFLAMNRRGQRETSGALGDFCVRCHAPVALREGLTTDGLNLADVPQAKKGVTCYFCHAAESVAGTHDNPLVLAKDDSLFGPFGDPASGTPHRAKPSALMDETQPDSATACGACHDIVNPKGAHIERTFQEWQMTRFSRTTPPRGLTCVQCHMDGSDGPASTVSTQTRRLHAHDFPAVDLPLTPLPAATDPQRQRVQQQLDGVVLQSSLCWSPIEHKIHVTLDNVGVGHGWPSGASQDRRAWVELTAYAGDTVIYSSGGPAAAPLEGSNDPDLWLLRDCLYDANKTEVHMFWDAAAVDSNQIPGSVVANVSDPASFGLSHALKLYPDAAGATLAQVPDRITMKVHLQAIGDDVLADLVASGDLDAAVAGQIPSFELGGAALEWTAADATSMLDPKSGTPIACVSTGMPSAATTPAKSHARCAAP